MDFKSFLKDQRLKLGTAQQAITFALAIDDHYDMRQFLDDWQTGEVAVNEEYADYWAWLRQQRKVSA